MKFKVTIKRRHLEKGIPCASISCAIALAVKEATGFSSSVYDRVSLYGYKRSIGSKESKEMLNFVTKFDKTSLHNISISPEEKSKILHELENQSFEIEFEDDDLCKLIDIDELVKKLEGSEIMEVV